MMPTKMIYTDVRESASLFCAVVRHTVTRRTVKRRPGLSHVGGPLSSVWQAAAMHVHIITSSCRQRQTRVAMSLPDGASSSFVTSLRLIFNYRFVRSVTRLQ